MNKYLEMQMIFYKSVLQHLWGAFLFGFVLPLVFIPLALLSPSFRKWFDDNDGYVVLPQLIFQLVVIVFITFAVYTYIGLQ